MGPELDVVLMSGEAWNQGSTPNLQAIANLDRAAAEHAARAWRLTFRQTGTAPSAAAG